MKILNGDLSIYTFVPEVFDQQGRGNILLFFQPNDKKQPEQIIFLNSGDIPELIEKLNQASACAKYGLDYVIKESQLEESQKNAECYVEKKEERKLLKPYIGCPKCNNTLPLGTNLHYFCISCQISWDNKICDGPIKVE